MIRLTNDQGKPVYINPETITVINTDSQGVTGIKTVDGYTKATESPEEVARKVLEWRLGMIRYRVALDAKNIEDAHFEHRFLERIAGLEEPNHD